MDELEQEVFRHLFDISPRQAVFLGLHEYDGRLPDLSPTHVKSWADKAKLILEQLKKHDPDLHDPYRKLDSILLQNMLERTLFDIEDLRTHRTRPINYTFQLSMTNYISRDYAPIDKRIQAVVDHLRQVPKFLEQAEQNLDKTLAKPLVDVSSMMLQGILRDLDGETAKEAAKASQPLREDFEDARRTAREAIQGFATNLAEKHSGTNDFALGRERFQKLLWVNDRISLPVEEVLSMAVEDLHSNLNNLKMVATEMAPGRSLAGIVEQIQLDHPSAESLLDETSRILSELEKFLRSKKLVSLPSETRCRVVATPAHMRATITAAMSTPGPLERPGLEGLYYVTPVEDSWESGKKEEWLRHLSRATLKDISIHEVYPGHYTHRVFVNNHAKTMTRKAYWNVSFGEGWAHYDEEMILDEGYAVADLSIRFMQVKEALLRDCRFIVSFRMHTQGLVLEAAKRFIMENALMSELPASREAPRGTYDHTYYGYTLGKLFIKRAREQFFKRNPSATLREFHDKLLSLGAVPVGILDKQMNS